MISIQVHPLQSIDAEAATYLGADIDNAWDANGRQNLVLLVPREEIVADFKVIKHVEHHEIHGAPHYETLYEVEVKECFWSGMGHMHRIINAKGVCWEILDNDQ